MPVEVHSESLKRRFIAPWASLACLLNLLLLLGAFILPVYICWATGTPTWGGLWQYEAVKYEQLALTFNNTFVVEMQGLKGAATATYRAPFAAVYTSSAAANDLIGAEALRGMTVRSSFADTNYDGVGDVFSFQATLPLSPDETVLSARIVVFMTATLNVRRLAKRADVVALRAHPISLPPPALPNFNAASIARAQQVARFSMDGLISAGFSSGVPGQLLSFDGDVTFLQRWPLPRSSGGVYAPYASASIASLDAATTAEAALPLGVLAGVAGRNFSLAFTPTNTPVWVPDSSVPTTDLTMTKISSVQRSFKVQLTARTPPSAVRFRPSIVSELKYGWIQCASPRARTVLVLEIEVAVPSRPQPLPRSHAIHTLVRHADVALLSISLVVLWIFRRVLFGLQLVETTLLADAPRSLAKLHVS
jgi:hypothetical protein